MGRSCGFRPDRPCWPQGHLGPGSPRFDEFRSENSGPKMRPAMRPRRGRGPPDGVDNIVIFSLTIRRAALAALAATALTFTLTGPRRRAGAGARRSRPARLGFRQLPRRPACLARARRRRGRDLLSLGAAQRSAQQRAARPHLPLGAAQRRRRGGGPARRPGSQGRQGGPHRAPGAGRARHQAEAIPGRPPAARAIGARPDHRSRRRAALGLDAEHRRREQGGGRRRSTSSPGRTGTASSRSCMPA